MKEYIISDTTNNKRGIEKILYLSISSLILCLIGEILLRVTLVKQSSISLLLLIMIITIMCKL